MTIEAICDSVRDIPGEDGLAEILASVASGRWPLPPISSLTDEDLALSCAKLREERPPRPGPAATVPTRATIRKAGGGWQELDVLSSECLAFSTGGTSYRLRVAGTAADLASLVGQPVRLMGAGPVAAPPAGEVGVAS